MRSTVRLLCLAACVGLLAGCGEHGPVVCPVTGTVTVDGQPLKAGQILFQPEFAAHGPDAAPIQDGKFSLQAKAGKNAVRITAYREDAKKPKGPFGQAASVNYLPAKYNQKTVLKADVYPEQPNAFSFELRSR